MGKQLEGDMEDFSEGMTFEPRPELHEETSHEQIGRKRMQRGNSCVRGEEGVCAPGRGEPWRGCPRQSESSASGRPGEQSLRPSKGFA